MKARVVSCALFALSTLSIGDLAFASNHWSYSRAGQEREVEYHAVVQVRGVKAADVLSMTDDQRKRFVDRNIVPVTSYLFGPLTHREIGGVKKTNDIEMDLDGLREVGANLEIPYMYRGEWLVDRDVASVGSIEMPIPLNLDGLMTRSWKKCSDSAPEHQTPDFFWYFWDPTRGGCDHVEGREYQIVEVNIGAPIASTDSSAPEYERLFRETAQGRELRMTIAFGYVADRSNPNPDRDRNSGMMEYRRFVAGFRANYGGLFKDEPIRQKEYRYAMDPEKVIGRRFRGEVRGVDVVISVVTSAGVDQMELFAKSYAHDHDSVFAWFGHSRVGSGFDADHFASMLRRDPEYYSISTDYQIIYWGGCNSYSYYTLPFFALKAKASGDADPLGTKNLDIIANGLPSYFALNSLNAEILVRNVLNWEERPSYQKIIGEIEEGARRFGSKVLAVVLGDEDNI